MAEMTNHERLNRVEALITRPMTYDEIGAAAGLCESTCRQLVEQLHEAKRIHIAGYTDVGRKRLLKQFAVGAGVDALKPKSRAFLPPGTVMVNIFNEKRERMRQVERILTKPMSSYEVANITGFAKPSVRTYLSELYDIGRIHIGGWRICKTVMTKLYLAGKGEDAPKPIRGGKSDDDEAQIFKRPPTVVHIQRDPLVAALFGEAA